MYEFIIFFFKLNHLNRICPISLIEHSNNRKYL